MNNVTVTVIIPTWNRRDALERAVESALAQQNVDVEVLVCDDGSNDGSREMLKGWRDKRLRLVTGPRAGRPAIPRNRGIEAAQGDWVAFLDDDDEWHTDKLARQLKAAKNSGCLAACADALRRLPDGRLAGRYLGAGRLPEQVFFADLLHDNIIICSSAVLHRSLFPQLKGFPESPLLRAKEDYALWLRAASLTPFAAVDDALLVYHDAPAQSIRSLQPQDSSPACVLWDYISWARRRPMLWGKILTILKDKKIRKLLVNSSLTCKMT